MPALRVQIPQVDVKLWPSLLLRLEALGYEGELQKRTNNYPVANAVLVRRGVLKAPWALHILYMYR